MLQARPHVIHFKPILDFGEGQGGDFGGLRNAETFRKKGIAGAYAHSGIYRVCLIDNMLAPVATFEGT